MSTARENILKRLKLAGETRKENTLEQPDMIAPIYHDTDLKLADWFTQNIELVSGKVVRVKNISEAAVQLKKLIDKEKWENIFCLDSHLQKTLKEQINLQSKPEDFEGLQVGITPCEFLVAHLGSALVSSAGTSGRKLYVYPETHVIIAHVGQIVKYLDDAIAQIQEKYKNNLPSMITNITGPSRTADIEKTLVKGMHGPKKLFILLSDEPF